MDAFLPTDRETGRPRGFGFVTFATPEQAAACVEQFNGASFEGRSLNINLADDRRKGPGGPRPDRGAPRRREPVMEMRRGGDRRGPPRDERRGRFGEGAGPEGGFGEGRPASGPPPRRSEGGEGGFAERSGPSFRPPRAPSFEDAELPPGELMDDRTFHDDEPDDGDEWGHSAGWKGKGKKRSKGSRRGLRAKKRSL